MRPSVSLSVIMAGICLACMACSFSYRNAEGSGDSVPGMVLNEAGVDRYDDAIRVMSFEAKTLELYDSENVWAAEEVRFTQFSADGSGLVEAEGTAGLMVVDDNEEIYTLGNGVWFHLLTDDLFFRAPDLRWSKKTNRLSGPENELVEVGKDDGTVIRGTGFFAETLSSSFSFKSTVSGRLVNGMADVSDASSVETENQ